MSDDTRDGAPIDVGDEVEGDGPPSPGEPGASKSQPPSIPAGWRPSYVFLAVVTIVNLVADLASKQWVKAHFDSLRHLRRAKIEIIDGLLNVIYATNKGGAWGLLQNETDSLRRPFFLVVSVGAIVFIISLYRKLMPTQRALKWGLPLVLGGALGNLIDRIVYGFVIDFIDVIYWGNKHWPTFNIADVSICVGMGLMAIDMFSTRKPAPAPDKPTVATPQSVPAVRSAPPPMGSEPAPPLAASEPPLIASEPPLVASEPPLAASEPPASEPPLAASEPPLAGSEPPPVSDASATPPSGDSPPSDEKAEGA